MCDCGCNTCETKGPLLTEGKVKSLLSEGLQYHIDKKIPLFETVYRIGSDKHLSLIKEARKMYSRNVIDLCEEDEALIKTHLGEFALYEGVSIPLDLPMLNESDILQEKLKGIDGKACWKGYKLSGTKKKGGKTVDNCVPMEEAKKEIDEAEFKGKEVALNKPKRGGSKAYYVYVKDGDKVKKVTFGSGGLRAKIKNKEARNAFAARHNCKDKKDRTKAGYWSCNLPRYAPALGLGAKMNTFW
mgnify:CR=1 FL=1